MNGMKSVFGVGVLSLALGAMAVPASAQTTVPAVEIGVGYQAADAQGARYFPLGLNVDVAVSTTPIWSVVGEVGSAWHLQRDSIGDFRARDMNLAGGIRFNARTPPPVHAAVEFLVGGLQRRFSCDRCETASKAAFMLQPGVQLSYDLDKNVGLMFGVSYRQVFWKDEDTYFNANDAGASEKDFRWIAGIKMRFP